MEGCLQCTSGVSGASPVPPRPRAPIQRRRLPGCVVSQIPAAIDFLNVSDGDNGYSWWYPALGMLCALFFVLGGIRGPEDGKVFAIFGLVLGILQIIVVGLIGNSLHSSRQLLPPRAALAARPSFLSLQRTSETTRNAHRLSHA